VFAAARPAAAQSRQLPSSSTLVVYFSRTGNTRVIANQIRRAHRADIFEIVPATPYPEDYEQTVSQAQRDREAGFEPPLGENVRDMASYDTVFLGFPIWCTTAPAVIRSFLSSHDFTGKTLIPFITHGGYGLGSSLSVVRERRTILQLHVRQDPGLFAHGFSPNSSQIQKWLKSLCITN
jgi:flavodoxin